MENVDGRRFGKLAFKTFGEIPGVGKSISQDLWSLGFRSIKDLEDQNPELMYENLCQKQRAQVDRCMLYVFRCAVYYASRKKHDPRLLKWWNWKDA